jgi:hypothetical protein
MDFHVETTLVNIAFVGMKVVEGQTPIKRRSLVTDDG